MFIFAKSFFFFIVIWYVSGRYTINKKTQMLMLCIFSSIVRVIMFVKLIRVTLQTSTTQLCNNVAYFVLTCTCFGTAATTSVGLLWLSSVSCPLPVDYCYRRYSSLDLAVPECRIFLNSFSVNALRKNFSFSFIYLFLRKSRSLYHWGSWTKQMRVILLGWTSCFIVNNV